MFRSFGRKYFVSRITELITFMASKYFIVSNAKKGLKVEALVFLLKLRAL